MQRILRTPISVKCASAEIVDLGGAIATACDLALLQADAAIAAAMLAEQRWRELAAAAIAELRRDHDRQLTDIERHQLDAIARDLMRGRPLDPRKASLISAIRARIARLPFTNESYR